MTELVPDNDAGRVADASALALPPVLSDDEVAAYNAVRTDAVWFDFAGRWSSFRGEKAAEALNGLVTNDVASLRPGEGQHAAALSPKGKLVADMLIVRVDEHSFLLTMVRSVADSWLALAKKYVNPRLATVTDESDRWETWMLYGSQAARAVASLGCADSAAENLSDAMASALSEWPAWKHGPWNLGPASIRLIRAPIMGALPGFILLADAENAAVVRTRLERSAMRKGTRKVWNIARIEGGRPAWGIDMDENTIPQEANLDALNAISFTKGCYTGQETVARIHFRGHVNRRLRGLLASELMPSGATITDIDGKAVGDVRSSAISPRLGPIGMAMIRREVSAGDEVRVKTASGTFVARVVELPFPDADGTPLVTG